MEVKIKSDELDNDTIINIMHKCDKSKITFVHNKNINRE